MNSASSSIFASLVQTFFCRRLIEHQNASPETIASYRDTFRLLFGFMEKKRKMPPATLTLADLDANNVALFLDYLQTERGNSIRTRNARFAAIRSFLKYVAACDPQSLPAVQRVLAIPMKRFARPTLCFLSREEMTAIIEASDSSTWSGQRDRILFSFLYNTGARVSEAVAMHRGDVSWNSTCAARIMGKGRKQRVVPLWKTTADRLKQWLQRIDLSPDAPLFPNRNGRFLSRSGAEKRLQQAVEAASKRCPALKAKDVSPHTIRHTTAMHLLQAGVDITVISLWLGHESPETTHQYVEASLTMKEKALAKLEELPTGKVRYRPTDKLLQFLDSL
jgi:integrase/recombinase XerD